MKPLHKHIRINALLLAFIILLQSCSSYQKTSIPLQKAIDNKPSVKLISTSNNTYKFHSLAIYNNQLIGITKDSKTIDNLSPVSLGVQEDGYNRYRIDKSKIKSIHPLKEKNNKLLIGGLLAVGLGALIFIISPDAFVDLVTSPLNDDN